MSARWLVLPLLVTLMGCDPVWSVEGAVTSDGVAVGGALVTNHCESGSSSEMFDDEVTTDAAGRFSFHKTGPIPSGPCTVTVTKDGYQTATKATEKCPSSFSSCRSHLGSIPLAKR